LSFGILGRIDFFDFVGGLAFICLRVFDMAPIRFELVFDLTRRFDEVLDLARFFAFFMIFPIRFNLVSDWASILLLASSRDGFPDSLCRYRNVIPKIRQVIRSVFAVGGLALVPRRRAGAIRSIIDLQSTAIGSPRRRRRRTVRQAGASATWCRRPG
jgi:hypothetical protein